VRDRVLEALKHEVLEANKLLQTSNLVQLTWGNVSGIDRSKGLVVIKPSGVDYDKLEVDDLVVLDLDGKVIEGKLNPSSDTSTHLYFYKEFEELGGVTHTHSLSATTLCQMGQDLPCLGTTHADHFFGTVPLVRALTEEEVNEDYELNTGVVIAKTLKEKNIKPLEVPAVLQHFHAPFAFGKSAMDSFKNALALESCARMALDSLAAGKELTPLPPHLLNKHYQRKHGKNATYGQKKN
jgi:L-ribulose-5-phosphate 4-epimerase